MSDMYSTIRDLFGLADAAREEAHGNIIPLIHRYILEQKENNNDYRGSRLWALCGFKSVLDVLFPESSREIRPPRLFIRNGVGTWTHKFFQNELLAYSGIIWGDWACTFCGEVVRSSYWPGKEGCRHGSHSWDYQEMEVVWKGASPVGEDILGHVDGILFPNGKRTLFDLKTTSAKTFNYYLNKPNEDHIYQLNVYMALDPGGANQALVLYVNLENGEMKSFKVFKDESVLKDAEKKIAHLKDWHKTFTGDAQGLADNLVQHEKRGVNIFQTCLPPRACNDPDSKRARFCPQKDQCWNVPLIEAAVHQKAKKI